MRRTCSDLLQGPTDEQVFVLIEALASRYPQPRQLSGEVGKQWWREWIEDLEGVPADLVAEACRRWRNSTEKWMPTPGQLKALVADELRARRAQVRTAREWLALAEAAGGGDGKAGHV